MQHGPLRTLSNRINTKIGASHCTLINKWRILVTSEWACVSTTTTIKSFDLLRRREVRFKNENRYHCSRSFCSDIIYYGWSFRRPSSGRLVVHVPTYPFAKQKNSTATTMPLDDQPFTHTEDIAVIGLSCRFPGGASDASKLWDLLSEKKCKY